MGWHWIQDWTLRGRRRHDSGATAVEYAIMASLIAAVIAAAVALIGPPLETIFASMANGL
nr:Flp family type IVb pilin [Intrasporangium chromatireducens]